MAFMKTNEEFKVEIFSRKEKYLKDRRRKRAVIAASVPLVFSLCAVSVMLLSDGWYKDGSSGGTTGPEMLEIGGADESDRDGAVDIYSTVSDASEDDLSRTYSDPAKYNGFTTLINPLSFSAVITDDYSENSSSPTGWPIILSIDGDVTEFLLSGSRLYRNNLTEYAELTETQSEQITEFLKNNPSDGSSDGAATQPYSGNSIKE